MHIEIDLKQLEQSFASLTYSDELTIDCALTGKGKKKTAEFQYDAISTFAYEYGTGAGENLLLPLLHVKDSDFWHIVTIGGAVIAIVDENAGHIEAAQEDMCEIIGSKCYMSKAFGQERDFILDYMARNPESIEYLPIEISKSRDFRQKQPKTFAEDLICTHERINGGKNSEFLSSMSQADCDRTAERIVSELEIIRAGLNALREKDLTINEVNKAYAKIEKDFSGDKL